ncbi:hypothetical protein ElyMa_002715000 [Elysia marginata]|uniref:Uncharacterized protein n=1 Tax=Elysia marginata TaxID=1093978 RepID=A0AAV4HE66_9GAST|nr:hypothetical protein ElyMa_002715000 [Elysia marginata]
MNCRYNDYSSGRKPDALRGGGPFCAGPATHQVKKIKATKAPTENQPNHQAPGRAPASQAEMPSMRTKSQTRKEAFDPTRPLASPRHLVRVGT